MDLSIKLSWRRCLPITRYRIVSQLMRIPRHQYPSMRRIMEIDPMKRPCTTPPSQCMKSWCIRRHHPLPATLHHPTTTMIPTKRQGLLMAMMVRRIRRAVKMLRYQSIRLSMVSRRVQRTMKMLQHKNQRLVQVQLVATMMRHHPCRMYRNRRDRRNCNENHQARVWDQELPFPHCTPVVSSRTTSKQLVSSLLHIYKPK